MSPLQNESGGLKYETILAESLILFLSLMIERRINIVTPRRGNTLSFARTQSQINNLDEICTFTCKYK